MEQPDNHAGKDVLYPPAEDGREVPLTLDLEDDEDSIPLPDELGFESTVFDFQFHPTENLIACGLVTGPIILYKWSTIEDNQLLAQWNIFGDKSCRVMEFAQGGSVLVSGSSDLSLRAVDVASGKEIYTCINAHGAPISALTMLPDQQGLISGDDDGIVKWWDLRAKNCVAEWSECTDFISDFAFLANHKLLFTSGDGHLVSVNLKKREVETMSDSQDTGLLSMAIVKGGKKVLTGEEEGAISIWSADSLTEPDDYLKGHPQSVDCILKLDEKTIATGSSDGLISLFPNKLIGVLGEHEDFPVEKLRLSPDGTFVASSSHDNSIRFWGNELINSPGIEKGSDSDSDGDDMEMEVEHKPVVTDHKNRSREEFFRGFQF